MKQKLLALLMPFMLCGIPALAHDIEVGGIHYVFTNNGTELSVSYRGNSPSDYSNEYSGNVTIPSSVTYNGTTYPVTSIGKFAFDHGSGLTSVTIPNSVKYIGSYAFQYCSGLTSVTIPNSVTSIGDYAFHGCYGLTSVTIPNSVKYIGSNAFQNCSGLTSVTIPSSVTSIGRFAFEGTKWYNNQPNGLIYAGLVAYKYKGTMPSGTSVVLKDGTTGITGSAFVDCSGLTSVTIPNSVTSIGEYAFYNCI